MESPKDLGNNDLFDDHYHHTVKSMNWPVRVYPAKTTSELWIGVPSLELLLWCLHELEELNGVGQGGRLWAGGF